ncbi:hypothetical protein F4W66_24635 (plasmid) [Escherichia coli]|nr:hypothetical protein F4W66_24635 [Escherichia coli]
MPAALRNYKDNMILPRSHGSGGWQLLCRLLLALMLSVAYRRKYSINPPGWEISLRKLRWVWWIIARVLFYRSSAAIWRNSLLALILAY